MKKLLMLLVAATLLASCANDKVINGTTYKPYGWMNASANKVDSVVYEVNVGNVVWDIIGLETVIIPVVLTGTEFYEPVGLKPKSK